MKMFKSLSLQEQYISLNPGFQNIIILGAGNLATHLVRALTASGRNIQQVYSRRNQLTGLDDLPMLPEIISDPGLINQQADLYIISVSDDAIGEVIDSGSLGEQFVVHTSGSTPMDIFKGKVREYGVFYPLQTFSAGKKVSYGNIPVCIESTGPRELDLLRELAEDAFGQAYALDSNTRLKIHMAAIYASNFTNHMYDIASEILDGEDVPFDIIRPLINQVARKVQEALPGEIQTGPAFRGDNTGPSDHHHHGPRLAGSVAEDRPR